MNKDNKNREKRLLFFLLLLAFLLRVSGIAFNIRILSAVPDENYYTKVVYNAFINKTLDIDFYWYPSFFFYFNLLLFYLFSFISYGIIFFLKIKAILNPFITDNLSLIIKLFIRINNTLLSTLLVYIVYKTARILFQKKYFAYLALILVSFNFQFIINSHIAKPDILHSLLVQLTIYLSLLFNENDKKIYFYLAILTSALATGTKILGGISVIVPIYFLFLKKLKEKNLFSFIRESFLSFVLWLATFLISTPFIVLKFSKAKEVLNFYKNLSHSRHYGYLYTARFQRFFNIQKNIYTTPELLFLIFSFIFVLYMVIKRKDRKTGAILLIFSTYMIFGILKNFFDARYYLPVVSSAYLLMVGALWFIMEKSKKIFIPLTLSFLIFIPCAKRGIETSILLLKTTTQEESYSFSQRIPKKTYYAFEIMTGIIHRRNNIAVMFLGRRFPRFYKNFRITMLVHNTNNYDMFFKIPEGKKFLSKFYNTYQWIFNHTKTMKIIKKKRIDFLNPPIKYLKLINVKPAQINARLKISGEIKNKSKIPFWLMSGNQTLFIIPPRRVLIIDKEFKISPFKGRSIFIFSPLDEVQKINISDGALIFNLKFVYTNEKTGKRITLKRNGEVRPNDPFIFYIKESK